MLDVACSTGICSISSIKMLAAIFFSILGISLNDAGLFHSKPQWAHNSTARCVLIGRQVLMLLMDLWLAYISIVRSYQKQLLSSFVTLFTDFLLRMLSLSRHIDRAPPSGILRKFIETLNQRNQIRIRS